MNMLSIIKSAVRALILSSLSYNVTTHFFVDVAFAQPAYKCTPSSNGGYNCNPNSGIGMDQKSFDYSGAWHRGQRSGTVDRSVEYENFRRMNSERLKHGKALQAATVLARRKYGCPEIDHSRDDFVDFDQKTHRYFLAEANKILKREVSSVGKDAACINIIRYSNETLNRIMETGRIR